MKKKYAHIDLPPDLHAFRANYIAATEVEATIGPVTCYKAHGRYFIRGKSSLTGKRVKRDKKFRRTMENARVLALVAKYVTPIYNALTEDWRCHDLYRKLVGIGIKHLQEGHTKETVQQAVYTELGWLGYRTAWPEWELPPNLQQWMEEEEQSGVLSPEPVRKDSFGGNECNTSSADHKKPVQRWMVNEEGQLVFTAPISHAYYLSDIHIPPIPIYRDSEVARPAGVG